MISFEIRSFVKLIVLLGNDRMEKKIFFGMFVFKYINKFNNFRILCGWGVIYSG